MGDAPSFPTGSPPALSHLLLQHPIAPLIPECFQCPLEPLLLGEKLPLDFSLGVRNIPFSSCFLWSLALSPMHCPSHSTPPRLPGTGDGGSVSSLPLRDTITLLSSRKPLLLSSRHLFTHYYPQTSHWHLGGSPPSFLS